MKPPLGESIDPSALLATDNTPKLIHSEQPTGTIAGRIITPALNPPNHPHRMEKDKNALSSSTDSMTGGIPVATSLSPLLRRVESPPPAALIDRRVLLFSVIAALLGMVSAFVAQAMLALIGLITNVSFHQHFAFNKQASPIGHTLGLWVILVPVGGALVIGLMARFGHEAIRGDGIPEAMEKVLTSRSRIAPRITWLKPLSAAISIGTGGPFGAEGPVISTGGALGSYIGQIFSVTALERKTLLAAGAAAGIGATFGTPIAAVMLAIEVLLFEFRPRSLIPVVLATAVASGLRVMLEGSEAIFSMPDIAAPTQSALALYTAIGALVGLISVFVTRGVHWIESAFEHLPIHWMWWPAMGAVIVGIIGYFQPATLGVGYINIKHILWQDDAFPVKAALILAVLKLISWSVALGSGTSGGTLAPLFTIGGGFGAVIGAGIAWLLPHAGVDPRIAALVGMAAMFAGASRALLFSVVFGFESTFQTNGLLPLLLGCAAAYLVSCLLMRETLMTEKVERRGTRVPYEYVADFLNQVSVRDACTKNVIALKADDTVAHVMAWRANGEEGSTHQGFPVLDETGLLLGVVTRRDIDACCTENSRKIRELIRRPPVVVYDDCTLREAADHMVSHDIGRLPVISRQNPDQLVGILTRSDLLSAHRRRLDETNRAEPSIGWPKITFGSAAADKHE